ncbi:poly-gamma-glutamate biosynthesis protein PgsC/CapC [Halostagnicola bangensis]
MIVAALLTIIGLLIGIGIVQSFGLRLSGVLVVPLFAVYSLYDVFALPAFVIGVIASYVGLALLQRRTLLFGRQLLLASMILSMVVPFTVFGGFSALGVFELSLSAFTFVGSILPGVAAYNYHQLEPDRRLEDVAVSIGVLLGLIGLGAALVNIELAPHIGGLTPPLLFGDESYIADARDATAGNMELFLDASLPIVLLAIVLGMIVSEGAYMRWGVRLNGIIALPLLALFALQSIAVLPLYVLGVAVVYGLLTLIHRSTLLYGRVLLATGLAIAVAGSIPVAIIVPVTSGLHLFFTAILIGIGSYNLHRMPPEHRSASIALSAGAFALFLGGLRLVVSPEADGALHLDLIELGDVFSLNLWELDIVLQYNLHLLPQVGLLAAAFVVGTITAFRLERLRPSSSDADRQHVSTHNSHT